MKRCGRSPSYSILLSSRKRRNRDSDVDHLSEFKK